MYLLCQVLSERGGESFRTKSLNVSGEELYFVKEGKDNALIWMKYEEGYYLLNLMLLYYDYAFIDGGIGITCPISRKV